MARLLLITGTDTGIGKTTIAVQLIVGLLRQGLRVGAMKPIETGCLEDDSGGLVAEDGAALRAALGSVDSEEVVLCKFRSPTAPVVAAEMERRSIDPAAVCKAIQVRAAGSDIFIVEGAGGLLVPLTYNYSFADLARELNMETLLVVGSKLGAINHACLTFEALKSRELQVIGYVFNDLFAGDRDAFSCGDRTISAEGTNRELLIKLSLIHGYKEVCYFPRLAINESALEESMVRTLQDQLAQSVLAYGYR